MIFASKIDLMQVICREPEFETWKTKTFCSQMYIVIDLETLPLQKDTFDFIIGIQ